jgi:peptidoglycan/xylan/chitin deacetylase (PgdA/CDA1 family)
MFLGKLKSGVLASARELGFFTIAKQSKWRQQRLLILCYHGLSMEDEHEWSPGLFISPQLFEQRLKLLQGYSVLPLNQALQRLNEGSLPPASVALTFDDGLYDFYRCAYPLLQQYGFPATVYLTTYYSEKELPIFPIALGYVLWKQRKQKLELPQDLGCSPGTVNLQSKSTRESVTRQIINFAQANALSAAEKHNIVQRLADILGFDFAAFQNKRIMHLMRSAEVKELSQAGIDFQLHTHRHWSPTDEPSFRKEIDDNRVRITAMTGKVPTHFCFPNGWCDPRQIPWMQAEKIASATTCKAGLAGKASNPWMLPRFVDTETTSTTVFESWLTGVGSVLPQKSHVPYQRPQPAGSKIVSYE